MSILAKACSCDSVIVRLPLTLHGWIGWLKERAPWAGSLSGSTYMKLQCHVLGRSTVATLSAEPDGVNHIDHRESNPSAQTTEEQSQQS